MKQPLIICGPRCSGKTELVRAMTTLFRKEVVCWWVPGTVIPFHTELLIFDGVYSMEFINKYNSVVEISTVSKIFITHIEIPVEERKHFKVWSTAPNLIPAFETRETALESIGIIEQNWEIEGAAEREKISNNIFETKYEELVIEGLKVCNNKEQIKTYYSEIANDGEVSEHVRQLFRNREIELEIEVNLDDLEG